MRNISLSLQTRTLVLALVVASLAALVGIAGTPAPAEADDTPFVYEPAIDPAEDPLTGEPWYETESPSRELQDQSTATASATATATATGATSVTATASASAVETEELSVANRGTGGVWLIALGAGVLLVAGGFLARGS